MTPEIILVRHGKVEVDQLPRDVADWGRHYDASGVTTEPPKRVRELSAGARCVVSSDLRRAIDSARLLGHTDNVRVLAELREVPLSTVARLGILPLPLIRVLGRVLWGIGVGETSEPIGASRKRAGSVATLLQELAETHGRVLAVGHGVFNILIATELRARGWSGPRIPNPAHWGVATYTR